MYLSIANAELGCQRVLYISKRMLFRDSSYRVVSMGAIYGLDMIFILLKQSSSRSGSDIYRLAFSCSKRL